MRSTPLRRYDELDRKNVSIAPGPSRSSGSGIAPVIPPSLPPPQTPTLYMPIASPPTPAPSPGPHSSYHAYQQPQGPPSQRHVLFPSTNPLLRRQFLTNVLNSCTPSELLFISTTIAPLLKRDFLSSLPVELAIHILGFIDEPKTLIRSAQVNRYWCTLVRDECVWKRMCVSFGFDDDWPREAADMGESKKHNKRKRNTKPRHESNDIGHLSAPLVSYASPAASSSALLDDGEPWQTAGRQGRSSHKPRSLKSYPQRPVIPTLHLPPSDGSECGAEEEPFSFRSHFKISYITHQNWRHGGHLLGSHRIPVSSPDSGVITSVALDATYVVVGLANSKIQVFGATSGVMVRTLVGHELGVWGVCLVSGGGWMRDGSSDADVEDKGKKQGKGKGKRRESEPAEIGSGTRQRQRNTPGSGSIRGLRAGMAGLDVRDGLDHLLSPAMRYALGLPSDSLSSSSSHGSGASDDDDEASVFDEDSLDDAASQHQEETPSQTHEKELPSNMCYSSTGWGQPSSIVVSGGCDKVLRVWDVESGQCIYILQGHTSTIRCIRVLHNRPIAISGSRDATLRVWDVQRGKCLRVLEGHHQSVRCLDVCGNRVVSGSYDNTCRVWDVDTGKCIHVLEGHFHQIYSVAFDGVRIASGGLDTTVRVWDAATGECLALLQGHTALVCQLQLASFTPPSSPSSEPIPILATGGSDGRVITFSLATYSILHRIAAHDSSVTSLQFDKRWLVTGGNDGRVRLFETETGNYVRELSEPGESVWKVVFGRDVCAVMCKRAGKSVTEIWSLRGMWGKGTW